MKTLQDSNEEMLAKNLLKVSNQMQLIRHYCQTQKSQEKVHLINKLVDTNDSKFLKNIFIFEDFLSENEEKSLLNEIEPYMKKLRYEFDHWDNAIHGYRETERLNWQPENKAILDRVKEMAFIQINQNKNSNILSHIHILDLHKDGYIKPHIDSVRFCGNIIAGLSLMSDAIMRFKHEKDSSKADVNVVLKKRSLYILKDEVRFDYTHEILKDSESFFNGIKVMRDRRISVICRNLPDGEEK